MQLEYTCKLIVWKTNCKIIQLNSTYKDSIGIMLSDSYMAWIGKEKIGGSAVFIKRVEVLPSIGYRKISGV